MRSGSRKNKCSTRRQFEPEPQTNAAHTGSKPSLDRQKSEREVEDPDLEDINEIKEPSRIY
jgi:hypothetical protein